LASAALGACAGLAGIDAYSKGSCNGGDCDGGADAWTGDDGHGSSDGSDAPDIVTEDARALDSNGDGGGEEAGVDAPSGTEAGSDCGPLDTTTNCGACGASCDTMHSNGASCTASACQYSGCSSGYSDCNKTAPDTDGCECATPGCCNTQCQTVHSNGVGQSFYDCNPLGTHTLAAAIEACMAYAMTVGGKANDCVGGWYCGAGTSTVAVCYSSTASMSNCTNYCWTYIGTTTGDVQACQAPCGQSMATWN
jgi:hypothetical protein